MPGDHLMFSLYFAGELFNAKHLIGNSALAAAIERQSKGEFICRLPQALEQRSNSARQIRDQDLESLVDCDIAIFNFDGTEVDSGTVVEFMVANSPIFLRSYCELTFEKEATRENILGI